MGLVDAGGEPHAAGEAPQPVRFAARVSRAQIPYDCSRLGVENPRRRRPRRLLIVLPIGLVAALQPVRPRFRANSGDSQFLRRGQHESGNAVLPRREIADIDQSGALSEDEEQRESHGCHNVLRRKVVSS